MPSPHSYGCCTRVNFVLKKHLLFQMNLSNSGLKNRSIKEYWLIFTILKFPLGLQFSHNLTKFKIIKYISTIYIMTTTCTYLQQLTQVSDVAHGPLVRKYRNTAPSVSMRVSVHSVLRCIDISMNRPSPTVHLAVGWIMDSLPFSHANNIYSPGSDKLTEVQLYMSTSCQPGSWVIQAFSDIEKHFFYFLI